MTKRRKKKGFTGKFIVLLFLIGAIVSLSILFKKEITHTFHPLFEKLGVIEERKEVILYFSDRNGEYLIAERRKILRKEGIKGEARQVVDELIKGPRGKLIPTLPPQTRCLTLKLDEKGTALVDFNRALSKDHPGGSSAEILTTYSIVNSLTQNFPQIRQVQILIEGKPIETIAGHLSLKTPIPAKPDLIKKN